MNFKEAFERIRQETDLDTLTKLANLIEKSQQYVSKKKREGKFPAEWAFQIAQKYDLSTDWILTGKNSKKSDREVHDSYLVMLEQWLEEYTAPDPRKRARFELKIEETFPEYREWLESKNIDEQKVA